MATRTISTRLVLEGEAEYRAQLKNVNAELALQKSELEKVESQYRTSANSMEALTAKGNALRSAYEAQQNKLELYSARVDAARSAEASFAKQADESRAKLENYRAQLMRMQAAAEDTTQSEKILAEQIEKESKALEQAEAMQQKAANSASYYQKQTNQAQVAVDDLNEQLAQNQRYLEEAARSTDGCATSIDQFGKKTEQAGEQSTAAIDTLAAALAAAGVAGALKEITEAIQACVDASIEFESAVTGVYKTVEGTPEQLQAISNGIKEMSTQLPASTTEIAAVAEAAGQLGIATDDVLTFSRVMLDLGESTNLSADEAATALARFANITGTSAENYERLGSVIVGLGNNFATTEAEITEMATRLASAGTLAGMTEAQILALATAMSSVGIEAEAGGTAMTQTLTAIEQAVAKGGESLNQFARIAGVSASEFASTWETDAVSALQAFISGLGRLDGQGESATLVLEEMGLSGVRQSNMLKSLALASDELTAAVTLANTAWTENTALAEEAGKRYETTESKLAMASNAANNLQAAIGDSLTPAISALADAGTDGFTWAAEFVEENPALVQAITGATAAVGLLAGGITAYAAATAIAKKVQDTLNLSMSLCPAIAVAAAIGALVVTIGSLAAGAYDADDATKALTQSMEESRTAYQETVNALETERADLMDMVGTLETLAETENKTTAQKDAMLALVEQLNEAVPDLNLAYNELDGTLNMTLEDIRAMAQAQADQEERAAAVERLTELYQEQTQLTNALSEAEAAKAAAEAEYAEITETMTDGDRRAGDARASLRVEINGYTREIEELTAYLEENSAAIAEVEGQCEKQKAAVDRSTDSVGKFTDATEENISAQEDAQLSAEELSAQYEELKEGTQSLADEVDLLRDAMQEQADAGSLSLSTALDLIDAGYAAALSIDQETGAITLNKDAYIQIAQAKLDAQIATLQSQKASIDAAIANADEARSAMDAALGYLALSEAQRVKIETERGNLTAMEEQSTAYAAQIAALQQLRDGLGTYTTTLATSTTESERAKTQAEKDLETYKDLKAELDHEMAMDLIDQETYYNQLQKLRDQYLTDDDNLDEYRKVTEELYQYDQELAEAEQKLWEEQSETLLSEYESRLDSVSDAYSEQLDVIRSAMDDLEKEQEAMAERLANYGDLFTVTDDQMSLNGLQEQIDAIRTYGEVLDQLRERGISDSLLGEVTSMDVDEAVAYGQQLLSMSEDQWAEYNDLWEEKQAEAKRIAEEFYRSELDTLQAEYDAKLAEALDVLKDTAFLSGQDTVQGLIDGMNSKEAELLAKAQELAQAAQAALNSEWGPSSTAVDGSHAAGLAYVPYDGYVAELHRGERVLTASEAREYIERSMPTSFDPPRSGNVDAATYMANALGSLGEAMAELQSPSGDLTIIVQDRDAKEWYRVHLRDFRQVEADSPVIVNDF